MILKFVSLLAGIWAAALSLSSGDTSKIMDRVLLEANSQHVRYSDGSVICIDGRRELLMAVTVFGPAGHDYSRAEIVVWPSHDGGRTWSDSERYTIQKSDDWLTVNSPSFVNLGESELLFFFTGHKTSRDAGSWFRRSRDRGKTWGQPTPLPYEGFGDAVADHAKRLKIGRILVPYYDYLFPDASSAEAYSYCFYSDDGGHTWKKSNRITVKQPSKGREIAFGEGENARRMSYTAEEPSVVELKDGLLLMLMRTYTGWFYKSYSPNNGATWSEPVNSGIPAPGSTPVLARIPTTGDLLLLYNYGEPEEILGAFPRNRLAAAISRDEGKNFSSVRMLDGAASFTGKMTQPNVVFIGSEALVFYPKSPNKQNFYSWVEQIIPVRWFYDGNNGKVFGEEYLRKR